MGIMLALVGIFLLLLLSESLWRARLIRGEAARKLIHIVVGTFVAFWPYFMSWKHIQLLSLAFLAVVALSMQFTIFHAVHGVKRRTFGELFFPLGIGLSALLEPPAIIFTAAILHLALADGFAALIGKKYGLLHQYKVHNYTKTLPGTIAFWVISMAIIVGTVIVSGDTYHWAIWPLVLVLPLVTTLVENIAVMGTDNIFVPLVVIGVLQLLEVAGT